MLMRHLVRHPSDRLAFVARGYASAPALVTGQRAHRLTVWDDSAPSTGPRRVESETAGCGDLRADQDIRSRQGREPTDPLNQLVVVGDQTAEWGASTLVVRPSAREWYAAWTWESRKPASESGFGRRHDVREVTPMRCQRLSQLGQHDLPEAHLTDLDTPGYCLVAPGLGVVSGPLQGLLVGPRGSDDALACITVDHVSKSLKA